MDDGVNNYNVPVIGPSQADLVVIPITEELNRLGLSARRYTSLADLLKDMEATAAVDVLVTCPGPRIDRTVMGAMPKLRALLSPVAGMDGFDWPSANELGVVIGNSAISENYESMTEAAMLMILAALYDLPGTMALMDASKDRKAVQRRMLGGKTVGLVSWGNIARSLASRLVNWNVNLQVSAPRLHEPLPPGARHVELSELMATSDVICVLCSLTDETRRMINAPLLQSMKDEAVLVNMSRGEIIDEEALIACCQARPGIRVALDAFTKEPLPEDSGLRRLPNAILTPHVIGHTRENFDAVKAATVANVMRVLAGEPPQPLRNPEVESAWIERWRGAGA